MHKTRRFFFLTLLACMALSHPMSATVNGNYQTNNTEDRSFFIQPSWALGGLVAVAILTIVLQRKGRCPGDHHFDAKNYYTSSGSHSNGSHYSGSHSSGFHHRRCPR